MRYIATDSIRAITADACGYSAQSFAGMSAQNLTKAVTADERLATPFSGDVTETNRRLGRDYPDAPTFQCSTLRAKYVLNALYGRAGATA